MRTINYLFRKSISVFLIITCTLLFSESTKCQTSQDIEDAESQSNTWMIIGGIGIGLALVAGIFALASKSSNRDDEKEKKKEKKKESVKDSTSVKPDSLSVKKKESGK